MLNSRCHCIALKLARVQARRLCLQSMMAQLLKASTRKTQRVIVSQMVKPPVADAADASPGCVLPGP
jgi:hypothetical protein